MENIKNQEIDNHNHQDIEDYGRGEENRPHVEFLNNFSNRNSDNEEEEDKIDFEEDNLNEEDFDDLEDEGEHEGRG